ncbi:hypothetical protein JBL43_00045 [Aureibaculum sp. A20]|uniref:Polysaccharide deacetylase n=1 Tax=Aureibaculum flavum TaxID=2795986 RepID=A0ABS0WKV3_9FLAO|nr:hypothetical protein [Aureibaculum flavum]MBJ2172607.1 hypothetical protein [Aureibaculum flavum]
MDFTVKIYKELLQILIKKGYTFQTFDEFIKSPSIKSIVLRHDVDLLPYNSLKFAEIQAENGVKGVYYFRAVPESWDEIVIQKIADLGHEIGYHYECLTTCNGDMEKGMSDFEKNLADLRKLAPVSTICMHGSPASKYDSKDLWKENNYRDYEIIGEPYFDVDFKDVFYMTDTGRMWDGHKVSVRDRVNSSYNITFHSTKDIIEFLQSNDLPNRIMFTFHPQRWNDGMLNWTKEYIMQHIKNIIKKAFYVNRK